jgi:outer membrane protein assembly factor BamA
VLLISCQPTKYVPQEEYLLNDYKVEMPRKIESGDGELDKKALKEYIKQKPNKRIFFWRFYLSLYNLSSPEKENGFNNWLKRIGEPPVVYDPDLKERSSEQLMLYMQNKGFYNVAVKDTTLYSKQQAKVIYTVIPNRPYTIHSITYFFEDATLAPMVLADTASSPFRVGKRFDVDVLQQERIRIETVLRDSGYYNFNRDYVYYEVDSSLNSYQVDVTLGINNYAQQTKGGRIIHVDHPVYRIRDVYMVTDYDPVSFDRRRASGSIQKDTMLYDSIHLVYSNKPNIRPGMVTQKNYIFPKERFDASNVARTFRNLSSLSAFRMVDIRFNEVEGSKEPLLDCEILAAPATRQSYTFKIEGTNSGGNIGAAGNVSYMHRNLFGGSEQFDLTFTGAIETLKETGEDTISQGRFNLMQEFGVQARLRIPKFLLPFRSDQFIRRYNPQTNIRLSYNYQKRPQYTRTLANASFGYEWRSSEELLHRVYPLEASLILTPYMRQDFADWLEGKYLFYSYEPHLIIDTRYSFIWSNQKLLKNQNFQDIRVNLETAGNLLYGGYKLFAPDPGDGNYQMFGVDFAQYVKGDIDFRSYNFIYEDISLILRGFAGIGFAYLNSAAIPFEKQYFSGGANSIRAWQVKNLGPGSYDDPEKTAYPNQTGDVKLEANMEYRFPLFWKLEAALFLDVGNIWSLSREDNRPGAGFEFKRFYKELAVGTGAGTRLVFSFFILRFDLGIPLRNPFPIEGSNWLPGNSGISGKDLTFNIAIGYPF